MGCILSSQAIRTAAAQARRRNIEIEEQLKRDRLVQRKEIRTLLIGVGNSDHSTLLNRMKRAHHDGYADWERHLYKEDIFSNTIAYMRALLDAHPKLELTLQPENDMHRAALLALPSHFRVMAPALSEKLVVAIRALWADPAVEEAFQRPPSGDCDWAAAAHYFDSIDRIAAPGYIPTDQDILHCSNETHGIPETAFCVGERTYKIFDMSRVQPRSDRRKWIHLFEDVQAVVFVASLADYDEVVGEDGSSTPLSDALAVFASVCNSRWFRRTSIILFLNHKNLFTEKLSRSPLRDYFPDYDGDDDDHDAAADYLRRRFVSLNDAQSSPGREIYAHCTDQEDPQQTNFFMSAIQNSCMRVIVECW